MAGRLSKPLVGVSPVYRPNFDNRPIPQALDVGGLFRDRSASEGLPDRGDIPFLLAIGAVAVLGVIMVARSTRR